MKVKFTLPAPKMVDKFADDGHPEGQVPMPAHVFRFVNGDGEEVLARDGQELDVPDDIFKRCLKPHNLAIPVESVVPNAGDENATSGGQKPDAGAKTKSGR